jgi:hypothetical protein
MKRALCITHWVKARDGPPRKGERGMLHFAFTLATGVNNHDQASSGYKVLF